MASFYEELGSVATGLLREFKQGSVSLVSRTQAAGSTAFEPGALTEVSVPLDAVVKGVSKKFVDGNSVLSSDLEVLIGPVGTDGSSVNPTMADVIEVDGVRRTIKKVVQTPAAGTPVLYTVIVGGL